MYNKLLQYRKLLPSLDLKESESIKSEIERVDKYLTQKFASYANFVNSIGITWMDVKEHIMYMDVKDIMSQSEGEYNKRQFRLKMYVSEK